VYAVDGTTNFVHAWPEVAISIGLVISKEVVVGCIYNPCHDEMYTAIKGSGAFLNGQQIHVSNVKDFDKAVVITEFGYNRTEAAIDNLLGRLRKLLEQNLQALRMSGSGALDVCYIARGIADGIFAWGWKPWDYCACTLLLEEAGGKCLDPSGGQFSIFGGGIIAGTAPMADAICQLINST